jgi:hypothetical protein
MKSPVVKRSILLSGHKTSVSLEEAFWQGLKEIAGGRKVLDHFRALAEPYSAEAITPRDGIREAYRATGVVMPPALRKSA